MGLGTYVRNLKQLVKNDMDNTAAGMVMCSQIMAKSIREDIGALFGKYHMTKAALALKILEMNKEKGWLVPPPLHIKRPEEVEK